MNLYKIYQDENGGYDTYDSAIVAAATEDDARSIHPSGYVVEDWTMTWANQEHIGVVLIGAAKAYTSPGLILASFNAG